MGKWVGVGAAQRGAIIFALAVQVFGIAASRRQLPEGRMLAVVRGVFISAYAAVAVTGAASVMRGLMGQVENWETWAATFYLVLIFPFSPCSSNVLSRHNRSVRHGVAATANKRSRRAEVGRVVAGARGSDRSVWAPHSTHL
ncbi:hypothetical protein [Nocardia beijingensis]